MDIITQGLMGAVVAQAVSKPGEIRQASIIGFCAPLLADADVLIRSTDDPLLFLENHRYFTHALSFVPVGALIVSLLLWLFFKNRMEFKRVFIFSFIGYATAGFLDACTSYGTHWLWPFSDERVAWNIISIFDPLFSLILIASIIIGLVKHKSIAARIGVTLATFYLFVGVVQHDRAESLARLHAQQRGHDIERIVVKPTIGNLVLWRSLYQSNGLYYVDAVRVGLFNNVKVIDGNVVEVFNLQQDLSQLSEKSVLYHDIQRFSFFSDGFLSWHPDKPGVLGDVRYSLLPTSIHPLWGIELKLDSPDQHVAFNNFRSLTENDRKAFFAMLLNK